MVICPHLVGPNQLRDQITVVPYLIFVKGGTHVNIFCVAKIAVSPSPLISTLWKYLICAALNFPPGPPLLSVKAATCGAVAAEWRSAGAVAHQWRSSGAVAHAQSAPDSSIGCSALHVVRSPN